MSDIIHLLPDSVANQIAAGEGDSASGIRHQGIGRKMRLMQKPGEIHVLGNGCGKDRYPGYRTTEGHVRNGMPVCLLNATPLQNTRSSPICLLCARWDFAESARIHCRGGGGVGRPPSCR